MDTYDIALQEEDLYEPFEYLANRALELARQDLVGATKSSSQQNAAVATSQANVIPDLLNLRAVPTHDRPILGCAGDRKRDFYHSSYLYP